MRAQPYHFIYSAPDRGATSCLSWFGSVVRIRIIEPGLQIRNRIMDLGSRSRGGGGGGENRYCFADNLHILNYIMTILFTLLCEISFTIYLNIYRVDFLRSFYVANFSKEIFLAKFSLFLLKKTAHLVKKERNWLQWRSYKFLKIACKA